MKKILKIRFTKFEHALAMQVMEQKGLPERKEDGFVRIVCQPELSCWAIFLRGYDKDYYWNVVRCCFDNNGKRDNYLDKAVRAITEELFTDETKRLKVGEMCEVSGNGKNWVKRMFLAVIPEEVGDGDRYIAKTNLAPFRPVFWRYARPLAGSVEPVVELLSDGDAVYTWESEVEG